MRKKSRMFFAILAVVCMVLFGVAIFIKKENITDYDVETYTYEETESGSKLNTFSENYAPTEN